MTFEPTHGMSNSPEYATWFGIKHRCKHKDYYIKKGIKVCPEWYNDFNQFYADMGNKPTPNHTIDRINNDLGYSPDNCRWATMKEQQNNKTNNRNLTYNGITQTLTQWGIEYDLSTTCIRLRLNKGMTVKEALTTPTETWVINTNYTIDGNTKTVKEWLLEYNIKYKTFLARYSSGWDIVKAMTTPTRKKTR